MAVKLTIAGHSSVSVASDGEVPPSLAAALSPKASSFVGVEVARSSLPAFPVTLLSSLVPYMSSSCETVVTVSAGEAGASSAGEEDADFGAVHTAFLLAGLTVTGESRGAKDSSRAFTASLSAAEAGVAIPAKQQEGEVDEDDLLSAASSLVPLPPAPAGVKEKGADDCGGRKACDNCSCGRAEVEAGMTEEELKNAPPSSSGCGSCGKGDAFRCASCPYLGKPAFKAGEEKVVLDLQDDVEF